MANGDIQITSGDQTYVLNYGANSACRIEEFYNDGRTYSDVLDELHGPNPRVKTIRAFVKSALISPADLTLEQVGEVIDQLGGWALVLVGLESQSPYAAHAQAALTALAEAAVAALKPAEAAKDLRRP